MLPSVTVRRSSSVSAWSTPTPNTVTPSRQTDFFKFVCVLYAEVCIHTCKGHNNKTISFFKVQLVLFKANPKFHSTAACLLVCSSSPVALRLFAARVRLSADFLSAMMTTAPGTLGLRPDVGVRTYCLVKVTASPAEGD